MKKIFLFFIFVSVSMSYANEQKAKDFENALKQGDGKMIVSLLPDEYLGYSNTNQDEFISNFSVFSKTFIKDVKISPKEKDIYDMKVVFTNNQEILSSIAFDGLKLDSSSFEMFLSDIDKVIMKSYATNTFRLSFLSDELSKYYTINAALPKQWSDIVKFAKDDIVSFGFSKPCVELKLNHNELKADVNIINQDDFYCKNFIESNEDTIKSLQKGYGSKISF